MSSDDARDGPADGVTSSVAEHIESGQLPMMPVVWTPWSRGAQRLRMSLRGNILFITGAGASIPYGFPSGWDLVRRVCSSGAPVDEGLTGKQEAQLESDFDARARQSLALSQQASIDEFLKGRQDLLDWGRVRIAQCILDCERVCDLGNLNVKDDWLRMLRSKIRVDKTEPLGSGISFATFNYDRVIEHFLAMTFEHSFNYSPTDALRLMDEYPVYHLHGSVGRYGPEGGGSVPFGSDADRTHIHGRAQSISLFWQPTTRESRGWVASRVREASHIIILGIGQAKGPLASVLEPIHHRPQNEQPVVYATGYGQTKTELQEFQRFLGANVKPIDPEMRCRDLIASVPWDALGYG